MKQHGVYYVTGGLRSGKSLICTRKIQEFLQQGRKVATNFDLRLENMLPAHKKDVTCLRIPDHPNVNDLNNIGLGYDSDDPDDYNESRFGLLVLDELGTWMNSRNWQDKTRKTVIDWLLHSGKKRWILMLIIQDLELLDNQVAAATANQYVVVCRRLGSYAIPVLSPLWKMISGNPLKLPDGHLAVVKNGQGNRATVADRWLYRGTDLYRAYRTTQEFLPQDSPSAVLLSSYLPPWYLVGRYTPVKNWSYYKEWLNHRAYMAFLCIAAVSVVSLLLLPLSAYAIYQTNRLDTKVAELDKRAAPLPLEIPTQVPPPPKKEPDCSEFDQFKTVNITGQSTGPNGVVYTLANGADSFTSKKIVSMGFAVASISQCLMTVSKGECKTNVSCDLPDSPSAGAAASRVGAENPGFIQQAIQAVTQ